MTPRHTLSASIMAAIRAIAGAVSAHTTSRTRAPGTNSPAIIVAASDGSALASTQSIPSAARASPASPLSRALRRTKGRSWSVRWCSPRASPWSVPCPRRTSTPRRVAISCTARKARSTAAMDAVDHPSTRRSSSWSAIERWLSAISVTPPSSSSSPEASWNASRGSPLCRMPLVLPRSLAAHAPRPSRTSSRCRRERRPVGSWSWIVQSPAAPRIQRSAVVRGNTRSDPSWRTWMTGSVIVQAIAIGSAFVQSMLDRLPKVTKSGRRSHHRARGHRSPALASPSPHRRAPRERSTRHPEHRRPREPAARARIRSAADRLPAPRAPTSPTLHRATAPGSSRSTCAVRSIKY